jgi:hypothetical protein
MGEQGHQRGAKRTERQHDGVHSHGITMRRGGDSEAQGERHRAVATSGSTSLDASRERLPRGASTAC